MFAIIIYTQQYLTMPETPIDRTMSTLHLKRFLTQYTEGIVSFEDLMVVSWVHFMDLLNSMEDEMLASFQGEDAAVFMRAVSTPEMVSLYPKKVVEVAARMEVPILSIQTFQRMLLYWWIKSINPTLPYVLSRSTAGWKLLHNVNNGNHHDVLASLLGLERLFCSFV
jgi:hypothetical protein